MSKSFVSNLLNKLFRQSAAAPLFAALPACDWWFSSPTTREHFNILNPPLAHVLEENSSLVLSYLCQDVDKVVVSQLLRTRCRRVQRFSTVPRTGCLARSTVVIGMVPTPTHPYDSYTTSHTSLHDRHVAPIEYVSSHRKPRDRYQPEEKSL
jgi:hypothetical protein